MKTIRILQDSLINKIAAGEVIEHPASVVKELVENSIDAKANNINIEIKGGGLISIKVEDDGIGMNKEDAVLCFERHATSKIQTFEDLTNVNSMGFRGEALASIAAVSKIELKTSQDSIATYVKNEASKIISVSEIARTKGTTIEVKSLFYNVPVRKKFQKSLPYINSEIIKTVTCLALSKPEIGFSLVLNDKEVLSTTSDQKNVDTNNEYSNLKNLTEPVILTKQAFKKRIIQLLSKEFTTSCEDVHFEENNIRIFGLIGNPLVCKKTRSMQYLIINDRVVSCPIISRLIKDAYSTRIGEDDFPIFALHINVPMDFIDVNVHPQKKEIRITQIELIKNVIEKAIDKAFFKDLQKEKKQQIFFEKEISFKNITEDEPVTLSKENIFEKFEKQLIFDSFNSFENLFRDFLQINNFIILDAKNLKNCLDLENEEEILIIDLSSIYSYFLFQKIKDKKNISRSQNLLIPINIDLNSNDMDFLEENLLNFSNFGFEIRIISKNSVVIDSVPDIITKESVKDLLFVILEDMKHFNKTNIVDKIYEKKIAKEISLLACKKTFSKNEAVNLLNIFLDNKHIKFDYLGNPFFITLNKDKIEKLFKK